MKADVNLKWTANIIETKKGRMGGIWKEKLKSWPTKLRGTKSKMRLMFSSNIEITWTIKFKTTSINKNVRIYTVVLIYVSPMC